MRAAPLRHSLSVPFAILLLLARDAFGQTPGTGAISGIVIDPANRAVANAEVLVVEDTTHIARSVTTTSEGVFRVPRLPPGKYSVTVNAPHFVRNTSSSIRVAVSETTCLNVTLAISASVCSGRITSTAANPRIIQFAAKYIF